MKKFIYIISMFTIANLGFSQVGISNDNPNANSELDIVSRNNNTGILIPRLTEAQRNAISLGSTENSLLIFNTTENCYNYWNNSEAEWKSLCGKLGQAQFTYNCTDVQINGTYMITRELTASNYLSIKVTVTKPGSYEIKGTTSNGYSFFTSGTFLNAGTFTVQVPGSGTPVVVNTSPGDTVNIYNNGTAQTCTPAVTVPVLSNAGTYSISCGSATVNGVYTKGIALALANTISLPIDVSSLGSYSITTNTVDGISFSASGTFTATGSQIITLNGTGIPTSTAVKTMTITANSADGVSTCTVNVVVVIPVKKVLHVGYETNYGYSAYSGPSRFLMDSPTNYGTAANSVVKFAGFTHTSLGNSPSAAQLQTALNAKPDIVILGYNYSFGTTEAGYLASYLNSKGVLIALTEDNSSAQNLLRAVFSDPSISTSSGGGGGSVYALTNTDDPTVNGPFGDVRGKNWGEDASSTTVASGLSGGFTPYSFAQPINSTTTRSGITGLRHNGLSFIWFGDGGFLSNDINGSQYNSNTIEPFVAPAPTYFPVQKTAYGYAGNGYSGGSMQVQNSILFANMIAWAIKQAEFSGINTK